MSNNKVLLAILDGWGVGDKSEADVIFSTPTPNIDTLMNKYPNSTLLCSGEHVGLPDGQMGNSEVGHLNIGAGRIVYQDFVRINKSIETNEISTNPVLINAFNYALNNNKKVHFIGLVSDGGVHSHVNHLYKLCDLANEYGLKQVFIHALTDGRDTDPKSGLGFITELNEYISDKSVKIASLCGRYYTMDRDKRWERVKIGYDLLCKGIGKKSKDVISAVIESYNENITDEFIKPIVMVDDNNSPLGLIEAGDVVLCFNFRTDRLREITIALTQKDMPEYGLKTIPLYYITLTRYDETYKNVNIVFDNQNTTNTLGEVISRAGKKQLRIAETEKYAHVTFFLSGGREDIFDNEERILVLSPKVATYDLQPEMSAYEVKDKLIEQLFLKKFDFIALNFANGDMVGHTGIYPAIQQAISTVDDCIGQVVEAALINNYEVIIIADHGNADYAVNADGSPNTAHSLNPVPCILVSNKYNSINSGILADVAPTVLKLMGLNKPIEMTGESLV